MMTLRLEAGPNFRHAAAVGLRGKTITVDVAHVVGVAEPVRAKVFDARIEGGELVLVLDFLQVPAELSSSLALDARA